MHLTTLVSISNTKHDEEWTPIEENDLEWIPPPPPPPPPPQPEAPIQNCNCRNGPNTCPLDGNCVHEDVVYGATVTILDDDNVPVEDEPERYVGGTVNWKERYHQHNRSFRIRDPDIQTTLSNYIWSLKDENTNFTVTWQILEKSKAFNPITMQCLLCLSEVVKILNPNLACMLQASTPEAKHMASVAILKNYSSKI